MDGWQYMFPIMKILQHLSDLICIPVLSCPCLASVVMTEVSYGVSTLETTACLSGLSLPPSVCLFELWAQIRFLLSLLVPKEK